MQIILLDKVVNLGNLGEIVRVKDGYARNFLIPSGRARRATETAIKEFEVRRAELEKAAAEKLAAAQAQGEKLTGKVIKLSQKAGVDGRLFGSVTNHDIAEALTTLPVNFSPCACAAANFSAAAFSSSARRTSNSLIAVSVARRARPDGIKKLRA